MTIILKRSSPGHLFCDVCKTLWCDHIEEYVRNFEDADLIWDQHPEAQTIEVPIVPTANVWQEAGLDPPPDGKKNYHLTIYWESMDKKKQLFKEQAFIGFVHPGEGRFTIREMILDWFIGQMHTLLSESCDAPGHGYHEEVRWVDDMRDENRALVQKWTLWSTGKCLGCTYDPSRNDAFIPDVPAAGSPWRPR